MPQMGMQELAPEQLLQYMQSFAARSSGSGRHASHHHSPISKPTLILSILVCGVLILTAIFLGVWYGLKTKPAFAAGYQNRSKGEALLDLPGYARTYPRQLTGEELKTMALGSAGGQRAAAALLGVGVVAAASPETPVLSADQVGQLIDAGTSFTVVLFSKQCGACKHLLAQLAQWVADGSLGSAKVALMDSSQVAGAKHPVVKAALATNAVPLSVNFRGGAAGASKLGAVPKDVFVSLVSQ